MAGKSYLPPELEVKPVDQCRRTLCAVASEFPTLLRATALGVPRTCVRDSQDVLLCPSTIELELRRLIGKWAMLNFDDTAGGRVENYWVGASR